MRLCAEIWQAFKKKAKELNNERDLALVQDMSDSKKSLEKAHEKLKAVKKELAKAREGRIEGAPKMVAIMTITEPEAEISPYDTPDEVTWKVGSHIRWRVSHHSPPRRSLPRRSVYQISI